MTWATVIGMARKHIQDTGSVVWDDPVLLEYAGFATSDMVKQVPELRRLANGKISTIARPSATSDTFPFPDEYAEAAADYIAFRAFAKEAGDTHDEKQSNTFLGNYRRFFAPGT